MSKGPWLHPSSGMKAVLKAIIALSKSTMRNPRRVHINQLKAFFFPKAELPKDPWEWELLRKKMKDGGVRWITVRRLAPEYRGKYYLFLGVEEPKKRLRRLNYYLRQLKKKRLIYEIKHPLVVGATIEYFRAVSYTPSFRGLRYARKHRLLSIPNW